MRTTPKRIFSRCNAFGAVKDGNGLTAFVDPKKRKTPYLFVLFCPQGRFMESCLTLCTFIGLRRAFVPGCCLKVATALGDLQLAGKCRINVAYNYIWLGQYAQAQRIIHAQVGHVEHISLRAWSLSRDLPSPNVSNLNPTS